MAKGFSGWTVCCRGCRGLRRTVPVLSGTSIDSETMAAEDILVELGDAPRRAACRLARGRRSFAGFSTSSWGGSVRFERGLGLEVVANSTAIGVVAGPGARDGDVVFT